jgi:hypothetical protein
MLPLPPHQSPYPSAALASVPYDRPTPNVRIGSSDRNASVRRSPTLWLSRSPNIRRPRKSSLHSHYPAGLRIRLGQNLSNSFERVIALTIASHLSAQSGQHVGLLDLVGLSLYVWSDRPIQSPSDLAQSIESGCPLQGWLVGERSRSPDLSSSPKLLAKAGVRLELAVG